MTEPQRNPTAYRRDLLLARQVVAQLRDQAMEGRRSLPRRGPDPGRRGPRCAVGRPGPGRQSLLACGRNIGKATSPGQKLLKLLSGRPNRHCGKISPRKACRESLPPTTRPVLVLEMTGQTWRLNQNRQDAAMRCMDQPPATVPVQSGWTSMLNAEILVVHSAPPITGSPRTQQPWYKCQHNGESCP